MIKKLRIKIITLIVSIFAIVIFVFATGISIYSTHKIKIEFYNSIQMELKNYDRPAEEDKVMIGEGSTGGRNVEVCVIEKNKETNELAIKSENYYIDDNLLENVVNDVISAKTKSGELKKYKLAFACDENKDNIIVAVADISHINKEMASIWITSMSLSFLLVLIIFLVSLVLSKIIIKPVESSIDEQKRFIADASHELKTPLTVISANNKILLDKFKKNKDAVEWLESSQEEIKDMNLIVSDMLALAKTDSKENITKKKANISKIAKQVCLQFDAVAYDKNIFLNFDIADDLEFVCNEVLIKRLFVILVDNAIKYEQYGGSVNIKLFKENDKYIFLVKNSGSLIPSEDLPHIFERFYRVDKSRSSSGTGLGLAIAKNIASIHGGNIIATSNEKEGTIFKVIL